MVEEDKKQTWLKSQIPHEYSVFQCEKLAKQLADAKVKDGQWCVVQSVDEKLEEETLWIGQVQVIERNYLSMLFSDIQYKLQVKKMVHFALFAGDEGEQKCSPSSRILVDDYHPRHLRERILSARAWINNGDSLHNVYQTYDLIEEMVKAMDHLQTFANIKSHDNVEIFQAKMQLKLNEWFGPIQYPVDPERDREEYICASEQEQEEL